MQIWEWDTCWDSAICDDDKLQKKEKICLQSKVKKRIKRRKTFVFILIQSCCSLYERNKITFYHRHMLLPMSFSSYYTYIFFSIFCD